MISANALSIASAHRSASASIAQSIANVDPDNMALVIVKKVIHVSVTIWLMIVKHILRFTITWLCKFFVPSPSKIAEEKDKEVERRLSSRRSSVKGFGRQISMTISKPLLAKRAATLLQQKSPEAPGLRRQRTRSEAAEADDKVMPLPTIPSPRRWKSAPMSLQQTSVSAAPYTRRRHGSAGDVEWKEIDIRTTSGTTRLRTTKLRSREAQAIAQWRMLGRSISDPTEYHRACAALTSRSTERIRQWQSLPGGPEHQQHRTRLWSRPGHNNENTVIVWTAASGTHKVVHRTKGKVSSERRLKVAPERRRDSSPEGKRRAELLAEERKQKSPQRGP